MKKIQSLVMAGALLGISVPIGPIVLAATSKSPVYTCDQLVITHSDNRTATISKITYTALNGAKFRNVVVDWGDSSVDLTTDKAIGQNHQYSTDGSYKITATTHFIVNNADKSATSDGCAVKITVAASTTSQPLPNTGPGNVAWLAGLTGLAGYSLFLGNMKRRMAATSQTKE